MADGEKVRVWSKGRQGWICGGNKTFTKDVKHAREFANKEEAVEHVERWYINLGQFEYQEFKVEDELARPYYWTNHECHKLADKVDCALSELQKWVERYGYEDQWREVYSMRIQTAAIESNFKRKLDYKDGDNQRRNNEETNV